MKKLLLDIQFFADGKVDAGVEFNFNISEMQKSLKVLKSEVSQNQQMWNSFAVANENWEHTANGVEQRMESLNSLMEKQEAIVENLKAQHALWATKLDESNPSLAKMAANIEKAKAELAKSNAEYEKNKSKLIEIGGEYKTLEEILDDFNRDINIANASFDKATVGMEDWSRSTDGLKAKLQQLTTVGNTQAKKVDILQKEYDKLVDAKLEMTSEGKKLLAQLTKEQTALAKTNKELEEYSDETYQTRVKIKELKDKVEDLTKEYNDLEKQEDKNIDTLAEIKAAIIRATNEYKDLEKQLDDVEEENEDVEDSNKKLTDGFTVLKGVISNLISDGIRRLITGLGDVARTAINTGIEWESSFTNIVKTVDATEDELQTLKKGLLELSTNVATPVNEINDVAAAAGQLGIKVANIEGFTEAMIKLGDSTNMDATTAANELARLAGITGMSQTDFDKLGSTLVELGNNLPTTEGEITSMALRLAAAGDVVGLTEAEILGLSASLSAVGVEAEMGGTALSKALSKMNVATKNGVGKIDTILKNSGMSFRELELMYENNTTQFKKFATSINMTSSELATLINAKGDLESFAEIAGVTADEFVQAFGEDAIGAFDLFIKGLGDTSDASEDAITMLSNMGITEVRLRDALTRLSNSGGEMTNTIKMATDAWEENSALTEEAERRYETLSSKIVMMKNQLSILAVSIYEKFSEPLKEGVDSVKSSFAKLGRELEGKEVSEAIEILAKGVGDLIKAFAEFISKWIPKLLKGLANLVKNWKTISKVLGTVVTGIIAYNVATKGYLAVTKGISAATLAYKVALLLMQGATKKAITAQLGLNAAQLANPIGLIIGLVAALSAGLIYLAAKTIKAKKADTEYTKELKAQKTALEEVTEARKEEANAMEERNKAQQEAISDGLGEVGHLQDLWDELQKIVDANGKIKDGYQARAEFIVGQLNDALGTEIKLNDGIIESYQKIQGEIDKTIQKKKAMIILEAKEEDYKTAVQNEATYREQAASDEEAYDKAKAANIAAAGKWESAQDELEAKYAELEEKFGRSRENWNVGDRIVASFKTKDLKQAIADAEKEFNAANDVMSEAGKALNTSRDNYQETVNDIIDYESTSAKILSEDYGSVIAEHSGLTTDWVNTTSTKLKDGTQEWLGHIKTYDKALIEAIEKGDADAIKLAEQGLEKGNSQLKEIAASLAGQVSTIEEMSPDVQESWKLLAENSKGIYLETIKTLSPEQQALLSELTGVTATGGANITAEWANIATNSLYALTGQQILFQDAGNGLVQMVINGVNIGEPMATDAMKTLTSNVVKKIEEGEVGATDAGKMLAEGVGEGIKDKKTNDNLFIKIGNWGKSVLAKIKSSLQEHSPSKATREDGVNLLKGLGLGIKDEEGTVLKQIDDFGKTALSTLQNRLSNVRSNLNGSIGLNSDSLNEIGQIQGKSSKTVVINQTNNSPRELSHLEIYRQTKNAAQLAARS